MPTLPDLNNAWLVHRDDSVEKLNTSAIANTAQTIGSAQECCGAIDLATMIFVPASSATSGFVIARSMSTGHTENFHGADQDAVKPFRDALMVRMAVIGNLYSLNSPRRSSL